MKRLKLTLNIGTADAKRLGLSKSVDGSVVEVENEKSEKELLARGWAVEAPEPKSSPAK